MVSLLGPSSLFSIVALAQPAQPSRTETLTLNGPNFHVDSHLPLRPDMVEGVDPSIRPEMAALLRRFPKHRPPLPEPHRNRYVLDYRDNRQGRAGIARFVAKLEAWMHRVVAAVDGTTILELGAGTLNHLPFEPAANLYDVIEPFHQLWADSPHKGDVDHFYDDIRDIPQNARYDKIISIAVLEHLTDLPDVVAICAQHLAPGGAFVAGFPSEGGVGWYSAWRFGTGAAYRLRTGLSYVPLMRHEHVNNAQEIESIVRLFFHTTALRRYPLPFFQTSLYSVITAREPDLRTCDQWRRFWPSGVR
jgi:SAM-dependent methyltransferase